MAFASLQPQAFPDPSNFFNLYTIRLGTGAATLIGPIDGGGFQVLDIAVSNAGLAAVPTPGSLPCSVPAQPRSW